MRNSLEDILKDSARSDDIHREGIVAAILTLAVVGTEKQNAPNYVIGKYKEMLQALRGSGDTWN